MAADNARMWTEVNFTLSKLLAAADTLFGDGTVQYSADGDLMLTGKLGRLMQSAVESEHDAVSVILDGNSSIVQNIVRQEKVITDNTGRITLLKEDIQAAWRIVETEAMKNDPDLSAVRLTPGFQELIEPTL